MSVRIPIIDLFAGPGGLGEGFSAYSRNGTNPFDIVLSIEKDASAHSTLTLRSFFRQFPIGKAPEAYYDYLRRDEEPEHKRRSDLFAKYRKQYERAERTAMRVELGEASTAEVRDRVKKALGSNNKNFVLLGGPPCQAYSIMGRSRNKGNKNYKPADDVRQKLYVEYLQIIADHQPAVFVMENVKGLLSATLNNNRIFEHILEDLASPAEAIVREGRELADKRRKPLYDLFSLVEREGLSESDPRRFMIRMEEHKIPQARHRLVILGVRRDLTAEPFERLKYTEFFTVGSVLKGLPAIRSGLSREPDNLEAWRARVKSIGRKAWAKNGSLSDSPKLRRALMDSVRSIKSSCLNRGGEFVSGDIQIEHGSNWYLDERIKGICNHTTRVHIAEDLHRYLFAACFALTHGRSPDLRDFPEELLPKHKNATRAVEDGTFEDRFRVQLWDRPSTTVTSHLAKDGHYFIHPDPLQCRSMTVREVARLQTFPDNYFFCGPRTAQYVQVGNAVPPLLACQIAECVYSILERNGMT